ncbi:hypothetical protein L195_g042549, partial [Trifolium pratense]
GPIVMNKSGYTEKGFKRKLAVQALFGKVFYLSESIPSCLMAAFVLPSLLPPAPSLCWV